jgi:hypothetical protein
MHSVNIFLPLSKIITATNIIMIAWGIGRSQFPALHELLVIHSSWFPLILLLR